MHILLVDDEIGLRNALQEFLTSLGHEVIACENGKLALETLEKQEVELVLTDQKMPHVTGLELIQRGRDLYPRTSFVLMTAHGSVEQAVEAIRIGADDYLCKPIEFDELSHRLARIRSLRAYQAQQAVAAEIRGPSLGLLGVSPCIQRARQFIGKVSQAASPVLILGPSGSGKEVLSRAIHESGPRSGHPFIAINCASLSEQLMDSELFGHEKGAFTGANTAKPGKFELARGGTLFLDEIGELAPSIQAKLLRVLQEKEFFRVGGVRQLKSDVRVIAATHRPLLEMTKTGQFREDLYFRLNVLCFELEPLAKRPEDLPSLIDFFWAKQARDLGRKVSLSAGARECLLRYPYPGNVRELQNSIERILVLGPASGVIGEDALPQEFKSTSARASASLAVVPSATPASAPASAPAFEPAFEPNGDLHAQLDTYERELIRRAMERHEFNQMRAAEALGISRGALQYKLKKYGIQGPEADAA